VKLEFLAFHLAERDWDYLLCCTNPETDLFSAFLKGADGEASAVPLREPFVLLLNRRPHGCGAAVVFSRSGEETDEAYTYSLFVHDQPLDGASEDLMQAPSFTETVSLCAAVLDDHIANCEICSMAVMRAPMFLDDGGMIFTEDLRIAWWHCARCGKMLWDKEDGGQWPSREARKDVIAAHDKECVMLEG